MRIGMPSTSASSMLAISTSHGSEKSPRASSRISGSRVSNTAFRSGLASKKSFTHGSSTPSSSVAVMAIDFTGGLSEDREYVFAEQPSDPEMRESVNTWVWDDGTEFGMPRIGVEAVADQWETHDIQCNLAFADGRVLNMFGSGKVHPPLGADG